ncbi:MAG: hypothetical protein IJP35_04515 [Clostridia bacterium]|nr:hypothetical protein [Clostridia bacterium]
MKSKRKMIAITVSLLLVIACLAGATVAYFTDTDGVAKNTIVVGNVEIELYEDEIKYNAADAKTNLAGITGEQSIKDYHEWLVDATGQGIMPSLDIAKNTYIENTGDNDAYVRFKVSAPAAVFPYVVWYFDNDDVDGAGHNTKDAAWAAFETAKYEVSAPTTADGLTSFYVTYQSKLVPGAFTDAGLISVKLRDDMSSSELAAIQTSLTEVDGRDTFNIDVKAEAIQTVGFGDDVDAAFTAFDGQAA